MEENKHKKSRAIIITLIILLVLILAGYLIYKNRDAFGVKTSTTIAKIFSPLTTSLNSKNLNTISVQAGEDLKKGDNVSVFGTGSDNKPIVMKTTNGNVYGYANQDISNGNTGDVVLSNTNANGFWNSFSGFLGNIFDGNNNSTVNPNNDGSSCTNGTDNFPLCTTVNGQCQNGTDNPPLCTTNGNTCFNGAINPPECNNNGTSCINGADNFPLCNSIGGVCQNGAINYPLCNNDGTECTNGTDNFPTCTTIGGLCPGGEINPPLCNNNGTNCTNGTDNYPLCTTIDGKCPGGQIDPPICMDNGTCLSPNLIDTSTGLCIDPSQCTPPRIIFGNKCEDANSTMPDLTVIGNSSPTSTTTDAATTLSTTVMNIGGGSTSHSFSALFSINTLNKVGVDVVAIVPTLEANLSNTATASYKFPAIGEYSVRVCVDKKSTSDIGTVTESNENNNCGPFTIIKVENSLPQPCQSPKLTDTDGKCIDASQCVAPKVINGDKCEACAYPNIIDTGTNQCIDPSQCLPPKSINGDKCEACAYPKITDTETKQCINPAECLSPKVINGDKCETPINACLLIDDYPLEFTAQEKADLAALLRKFYLIAPTLKTEDDISLAYTNDSQYQNFSEYMKVLINQCYAQSGSKDGKVAGVVVKDGVNTQYQGPGATLRFGNPWYEYSTNRGYYSRKITTEEVAEALQCLMTQTQTQDPNMECPAVIDTSIMENILNVW